MTDPVIEELTRRIPVRALADLDALDDAEIVEGYWDGRENFPCGANRSRSYWHGWRNGMADYGHAETDDAQAALAHVWLKRERERKQS